MHSDLGAHSQDPLVWPCRATPDVPQGAGPHWRPGGATGPSQTGSHQLWWLLPPLQGSFHCYTYSCIFHPSFQAGLFCFKSILVISWLLLNPAVAPFPLSWDRLGQTSLWWFRMHWLHSRFYLNRHRFLGHSTRVGCTSTPTLKGVIKMQQDWKNFTSQWNVTSFVSRCWRRWG